MAVPPGESVSSAEIAGKASAAAAVAHLEPDDTQDTGESAPVIRTLKQL